MDTRCGGYLTRLGNSATVKQAAEQLVGFPEEEPGRAGVGSGIINGM